MPCRTVQDCILLAGVVTPLLFDVLMLRTLTAGAAAARTSLAVAHAVSSDRSDERGCSTRCRRRSFRPSSAVRARRA